MRCSPGTPRPPEEAYLVYAGYRAVQHLLAGGQSLGALARLRENDLILHLDRTCADMGA